MNKQVKHCFAAFIFRDEPDIFFFLKNVQCDIAAVQREVMKNNFPTKVEATSALTAMKSTFGATVASVNNIVGKFIISFTYIHGFTFTHYY